MTWQNQIQFYQQQSDLKSKMADTLEDLTKVVDNLDPSNKELAETVMKRHYACMKDIHTRLDYMEEKVAWRLADLQTSIRELKKQMETTYTRDLGSSSLKWMEKLLVKYLDPAMYMLNYSQIKSVIDLLFVAKRPLTPKEINQVCGVNIYESEVVYDSLTNNNRVHYDGELLSYKSKMADSLEDLAKIVHNHDPSIKELAETVMKRDACIKDFYNRMDFVEEKIARRFEDLETIIQELKKQIATSKGNDKLHMEDSESSSDEMEELHLEDSAETDMYTDDYEQIKCVIDLLFMAKRPLTPKEIYEACYVDIYESDVVFDSLTNNSRVHYDEDEELMSYKVDLLDM